MILAIIQARMGSSRFPGKVLADLGGKPVLDFMVERVRRSQRVSEILIATSDQPEDDPIVNWAREAGVACYRGSEHDVLDRFYRACLPFERKLARGGGIVRLTADCPLIDPRVIDGVVERYSTRGADVEYVSNAVRRTFPDGMDVEVFTWQALDKAWRKAHGAELREHVTKYLYSPTASGNAPVGIDHVEHPVNLGNLRWTLDYPMDLDLMRAIVDDLGALCGMEEILAWTRANPDLASRNRELSGQAYASKYLKRSMELLGRARTAIPAITQTLSKRPGQFAQGLTPVYAEKGEGCWLYDVDGGKYLDLNCSLAAVILGYNIPEINDAVQQQLRKGVVFTLPTALEVELSEKLIELIPCAEMVRFAKNGSDATSGAVRLARAVTGRERVAVCGYHGAQDWYIATTTWVAGVPKAVRGLSHAFAYNDLDSLEQLLNKHPNKFACVILEPVSATPPADGFLQGVIDLAHRHGALVIFDEVVTGLRFGLSGAQGYFNAIPDLACFGKSLANGLPLSAVVGRRDVMQRFESIFFSYTFGGEALSLAAAKATIEFLERNDGVRRLWDSGERLAEGCKRLIRENGLEARVRHGGYAPRQVFRFLDSEGKEDLELKTLFLQEAIKRRILTMGSHNLCWSHDAAAVDTALNAYKSVFQLMREAVEQDRVGSFLQVPPLEPVFRKV